MRVHCMRLENECYYDRKTLLLEHSLPLEIVVECNFPCSSKFSCGDTHSFPVTDVLRYSQLKPSVDNHLHMSNVSR